MGSWKINLPVEREIKAMNEAKIEKNMHLKVIMSVDNYGEGEVL